jgi:peptidyl-dipeptidase A
LPGWLTGLGLFLAGCAPQPTAPLPDRKAEARALVATINAELPAERRKAQLLAWQSADRDDPEIRRAATRTAAEELDRLAGRLASARSLMADADPETRRALELLRVRARTLPPLDPAARAELAMLEKRQAADYALTPACAPGSTCRSRGEWLGLLAHSQDAALLASAWQATHAPAAAHREDFQRLVELRNLGARDWGYADAGEHWRAGHDMAPSEFALEIERLWAAAEPLYRQLHCHARRRLAEHHGSQHFTSDGLIPAHLLGHPSQMDWSSLHRLLAPESGLSLEPQSRRVATSGRELLDQAAGQLAALGLPRLPGTLAGRSRLEPGAAAACHPSAWNIDLNGDVRIRLCLQPSEAALRTALHELGHVHYYYAYRHQPALFQLGASPAFHEAVGDLLALGAHPARPRTALLAPESARLNRLMQEALRTLPFLPYARLLDQWRWAIYAGHITPSRYNQSFWEIKAAVQGIAPPQPRGEAHFDAGVQFHVLAHAPLAPYFLARFQAFDWQRALCRRGGHEGPAIDCSADQLAASIPVLQLAMAEGARTPWTTLHARITGSQRIDPSALVDYFAPLSDWLGEQNAAGGCGP